MFFEQPPIILDSGSFLTKIGFKNEGNPRAIFPTVIGYTEDLSSMRYEDFSDYVFDYYIGEKVFSSHRIKKTIFPIWNLIKDWDSTEKIWHYAFFDRLQVNPNYNPIMLVEPLFNKQELREKTAEIMFDIFCVPKLFFASSPLLSLYATGKTTGIVVESSASATTIVPIYKGAIISHAITYSNVGGYAITKYLHKLLGNVYRIIKPRKFIYMINEVKEKLCYIALDYKLENNIYSKTNRFVQEFILPDGEKASISIERFKAPELLFNPLLDGYNDEPLPNLIEETIKKCDMIIRKELLNNIILSGGNTLIHGFKERLLKELKKILTADLPIQIQEIEERAILPWIGGRKFCDSVEKNNSWITRKKYMQSGLRQI